MSSSASIPPALPKKRPVWPWIVGGCGCATIAFVAFIGIIFFGVFKLTAEPHAVITGFLDDLAVGDYASAYEACSDELQQEQSFDDFELAMIDHSELLKIVDSTFNNRSVENNRASFSGSLKLVSGESIDTEFELIERDGTWKITRYQIGE